MGRLKFIVIALAFTVIWVTPNNLLAESNQVYVKVRSTKLRSAPKHWATGVSALKYGDTLTKLEESDGWVKVKSGGGASGYLHQSALSDRKVVLKSSSKFQEAGGDSSDVILAGKGFSPEVEKNYAAGNSELDFRSVDEMERLRVGEQDLASFISSGKLG